MLTRTGDILGTPAYMSPEQAKEEPIDHRCDLFSLGCVMYHMVTGRPPFAGSGVLAVLRAVAEHQPAAPAERSPGVPTPLSALIMRLLAKNPDDRPPTATAVIEALTAIEQGSSTAPTLTIHSPHATHEDARGQQAAPTASTSAGAGRDEPHARPTIARKDLFRIETPGLPAEDDGLFNLDIGFFRARLKNIGAPTAPVFCGCAGARLQVHFKEVHSTGDPSFPTLPANARARVEYGIGSKPSVRFEAADPSEILDGRARVAFSLAPPPQGVMKVTVTLQPEWFTVTGPSQGLLDGAVRVVVDAVLRELVNHTVTRRFILEKSDAPAQGSGS
jgi:hypothetical protein